jgi:hypothetical protein
MSPAQRIEHLNRLLASTSPGEYERLSRIAEGRLAAGDEPPQAVAAMRRQGVPELLAQHVVDEQFAAQKTRLRMRGLLQLGGGILLVALAALLWNTDSSDLPAPGRRGLNKLLVLSFVFGVGGLVLATDGLLRVFRGRLHGDREVDM